MKIRETILFEIDRILFNIVGICQDGNNFIK